MKLGQIDLVLVGKPKWDACEKHLTEHMGGVTGRQVVFYHFNQFVAETLCLLVLTANNVVESFVCFTMRARWINETI